LLPLLHGLGSEDLFRQVGLIGLTRSEL
jgi:hypothetical protein